MVIKPNWNTCTGHTKKKHLRLENNTCARSNRNAVNFEVIKSGMQSSVMSEKNVQLKLSTEPTPRENPKMET